MARYSKDHKQATRRRIIETAGRRLKQDGIDGAGIATLMADAGLTNGAFYAHFGSKDDLVAETVGSQLEVQRQILGSALRQGGLAAVVETYLSGEHCDDVGGGCPSAALLDEIARSSPAIRVGYTKGVLELVDEIAGAVRPEDPGGIRVEILAVLAQLIGTLQLARALTDRELAEELLKEATRSLLDRLKSLTSEAAAPSA